MASETRHYMIPSSVFWVFVLEPGTFLYGKKSEKEHLDDHFLLGNKGMVEDLNIVIESLFDKLQYGWIY